MELLDLSGAVLDGRYRVIEPIAEGAMGIVYRAERVKLGRIVAVKVLHDELPGELASRKRFEVEAMAMAKLEHPHCAAVLDVGIHEDRPYVVMDFVSGRNLKELIAAEAPLPIARAVELVRQVLSGLAHAHELDIIHRDIKPANLVLSRKAGLGDHVTILDFGLARVTKEVSTLTTGVVVGTPSYMAPEQIRGGTLDRRADLYACGILLFELLTGRKPFVSERDDPVEVCGMHLSRPPPRLADARPDVAFGALEAIVARALAKEPADRFASAEEMAAALDAVAPRRGTPMAGVPIEPGAGTSESSLAIPQVTPPGSSAPVPGIVSGPGSGPAAGIVAAPAAGGVSGPTLGPGSGPVPGPSGPVAAAPGPDPVVLIAPPPGAAIAPPSITRRQLTVVGGVVGGVLLLAIIVAASRGGATEPAPADAQLAAPDPIEMEPHDADPLASVLARADELLAAGQSEAALQLLVSSRQPFPDDARLPLRAGRLYFTKLWFTDGLKQLRDAVRLDASLRADPELIKTVLRGFITTPRYNDDLARFLRDDIGAAARPYLEETAAGHPNPSIRQRAARELERYP